MEGQFSPRLSLLERQLATYGDVRSLGPIVVAGGTRCLSLTYSPDSETPYSVSLVPSTGLVLYPLSHISRSVTGDEPGTRVCVEVCLGSA